MKIKTLLLLFVVTFFTHCAKEDMLQPEVAGDAPTHASSTKLLKRFSSNDRYYDFSYNEKGDVDSIKVSESNYLSYVYNVVYQDDRIFRVELWDGGEIVATNDNFTFNKRGDVTSYRYTFFLPDLEEGIASTINVGYDQRGRIISLGGDLSYTQQSDVSVWQQGSFTWQYTHDKFKNPLYAIDNLFVMLVEEPVYWEYLLSRHNITSKSGSDGSFYSFTNIYDSKNRLTDIVVTRNGNVEQRLAFYY